MKKDKGNSRKIREAVGVFEQESQLREAIEELKSRGFRPEEIGLLAGEYTVRQSLGDFYTQTNLLANSPDTPNSIFVAKESMGDTVHAYLGSLFFAGTTVAAGLAVASAAVLGGGLVAAVAGSAAIGGIGAALELIIHESDAEELEQQVDEGHLLLFVRARDATHEQLAVEILNRHSPIEVRVVDAPAAS
jgi:hypothetical protein